MLYSEGLLHTKKVDIIVPILQRANTGIRDLMDVSLITNQPGKPFPLISSIVPSTWEHLASLGSTGQSFLGSLFGLFLLHHLNTLLHLFADVSDFM